MKLSIIIPAYNAEKTLVECVQSISSELPSENLVEIILINDGSKDNTDRISRELSKKNKFIKYIKNENHGVSYTRNIGIKMSTGDYVMFVDADDKLRVNWYKNIMDTINTRKNPADIYYFNNNINSKTYNKTDMILEIVGMKNSLKYLSAPWSKLYKRSLLIKNNILFIDKIINGEDTLFNLECINKCKSYKLIKKGIYSYRISPFSATQSFNEKIFDSDINFHNNLKKILDLYPSKGNQAICNYLLYNAIFIISQRISYNKTYNRDTKGHYEKLSKYPYSKALIPQGINVFKILIVNLIRKRAYFFVYNIFKAKRVLKIRGAKHEEYFIEI